MAYPRSEVSRLTMITGVSMNINMLGNDFSNITLELFGSQGSGIDTFVSYFGLDLTNLTDI